MALTDTDRGDAMEETEWELDEHEWEECPADRPCAHGSPIPAYREALEHGATCSGCGRAAVTTLEDGSALWGKCPSCA